MQTLQNDYTAGVNFEDFTGLPLVLYHHVSLLCGRHLSFLFQGWIQGGGGGLGGQDARPPSFG